jgi:hypothetical protein
MEENSDLMLAIKLAKERRNEKVTYLADKLVTESVTRKDYLHELVDGIASMNENIKVMEDALIAVNVYKRNNEIE